jgi:hypothetical protein
MASGRPCGCSGTKGTKPGGRQAGGQCSLAYMKSPRAAHIANGTISNAGPAPPVATPRAPLPPPPGRHTWVADQGPSTSALLPQTAMATQTAVQQPTQAPAPHLWVADQGIWTGSQLTRAPATQAGAAQPNQPGIYIPAPLVNPVTSRPR